MSDNHVDGPHGASQSIASVKVLGILISCRTPWRSSLVKTYQFPPMVAFRISIP